MIGSLLVGDLPDLSRKTALLALLAAAWVFLAFRAAWRVRAFGRRWWVWFLISLAATIVPATVVLFLDYYRRRQRELAGTAVRCVHCGQFLPETPPRVGGHSVCPRCRLTVEGNDLA